MLFASGVKNPREKDNAPGNLVQMFRERQANILPTGQTKLKGAICAIVVSPPKTIHDAPQGLI